MNRSPSLLMRDFDDDKHIERFCRNKKCSACVGSDESGEPNGYGCKASEDYSNKMYSAILKRRLKKLFKDADKVQAPQQEKER